MVNFPAMYVLTTLYTSLVPGLGMRLSVSMHISTSADWYYLPSAYSLLLCSEEEAEQYPVFTFSSGPTNSMRGAAFLSNLPNAIVVDIGGTTTDIGVLKNGFPREASSQRQVSCWNIHFHRYVTIYPV